MNKKCVPQKKQMHTGLHTNFSFLGKLSL